MEASFLGIDIGSTAVKAILIDSETLSPLVRSSCVYPTKRENGFVTQSPDDWVSAAACAVKDAVTQSPDTPIAAISVSAQGGSIFAADKHHCPITDAVSWMDSRASAEADELYRRFGEKIYNSCGWRLSPLDDASKLLWLRKNAPSVFSDAEYFMTTADYITGRLCGRYVYDPTSAAITRLYDIAKADYNDALMEYIEINRSQLSDIMPCGAAIGTTGCEAAEIFGIDTGIPVYCGAHDQYCAAIGSGVGKPGDLLIATGTAWVLFGVTKEPGFSPLHIAPGVFPSIGRSTCNTAYGAIASLSGIGASVDRFASAHGRTPADSDAEASMLLARRGHHGDDYFALTPCEDGRGFLYHRPGSGIEFRCTPGKSYAECYLALLEGASFEVLSVAEKMKCGNNVSVIMSGGAARSGLWSHIVASAAATRGWSLDVTSERDAPAFGAALIAAASCGKDISDVCRTNRVVPDEKYAEYMGHAFDIWKEKILIK